MRRIFDTDFHKLIIDLLPGFFRKPRICAIVQVMQSGIRTMHLLLLSFRYETRRQLSVSPQVFSLRKMLNDYFDNENQAIKVEDAQIVSRTYLFNPGEKIPTYLGTTYINSSRQFAVSNGFVVIAPFHLNNTQEEARIRAMINMYKLAGTQYLIRYE